jgi:hypothetical protein
LEYAGSGPATPDLQQIRGGGGELGFGLGRFLASAGELPKSVPVFELCVHWFDRDAATSVSSDPFRGGQPSCHGVDGMRQAASLGASGCPGGGLESFPLPGADQPVWAGHGQIV